MPRQFWPAVSHQTPAVICSAYVLNLMRHVYYQLFYYYDNLGRECDVLRLLYMYTATASDTLDMQSHLPKPVYVTNGLSRQCGI